MIAPDIAGVTILDELGRGGFSVVYRAEQTSFSRIVAVKVFSLDPTDTELVATFVAEAQNIGELAARPDVVTVYETGLDAVGRPYLLLQYLPGGSLSEQLRDRGTLTVSETVTIGCTVAGVLVAAHDQGILHCDLKPANVLFDAAGRPVLADFGIARATAAADSSRSMAFLTPDHAAPELWEGRPPTVATDLYALGSMLHQLLVGRAPFQDPTGARLAPLQVMRRVLAEPAPPILRPDVPPRLARLVDRLLSKEPADRPQSATEVLDELRSIESDVDAGTVPKATTAPGSPPHRDTASDRPDDDRTRRRVRPFDPVELIAQGEPVPAAGLSPGIGLSDPPPPVDPLRASPEPSSLKKGDLGDGQPSSRTRISPVAVVGVAVGVVTVVTASILLWSRDTDTRDGGRNAGSTSTSVSVVDDPAPVLKLSGDAQRDGTTRILIGTITGPQPWFASISVIDEAFPEPIGRVVVGGDSPNRIQVDRSGSDVRLFVSEMTSADGETVPLPADRRLCFRSTPEDPASDPTTACDPAS